MANLTVTPLDELPDSMLLDTSIAAYYLGLKENTLNVWRCTKRHKIPFCKMGTRVKYKAGDIKAFITAQTVE